jgi:hypothetical protein
MYIPHIFRTDPLAVLAVFLYLATIWWCIRVIRRRQRGTDRLLLGRLGLVALSQSFGVFKHLGILESSVPFHRLGDFVNLAISGLYLIGDLLLEISSRNRISAGKLGIPKTNRIHMGHHRTRFGLARTLVLSQCDTANAPCSNASNLRITAWHLHGFIAARV